MSNLLVALLVLIYTAQSAFCNQFARHYPGEKRLSSDVYSVLYGVIVALVTAVFAGFSIHPSVTTVIFGVVNGLTLVLYNFMLIKASSNGPFSITMIMNLAGGILIPMFWSMLYYHEVLSVWQYIAIGVMIISFVLLNFEKSDDKISGNFIVYCLILGLANGIYGTLMSAQKKATEGSEDAEMIIVTFIVSAAAAFILLVIHSGKKFPSAFRLNTKSALSALTASVAAATAVNLLMYVLSLINVAVLYSLDNGGVLVVSVIWSVIVLHEKLSKTKLIGIILAVGAIFALSIL